MKRIPSLDGLRAISITMVVLGHLAKSAHAPRVFWDAYAATGVRIFFVISGYLITTLLLREYERSSTISLRSFYVRRGFRIFPAAVVFLLLVTVVFWGDLRWYHMVAAWTYAANYDFTRPWIFGHLWSLSVEEQFYFLWPNVLKRWYRRRTAILLGVVALAPASQALFYFFKVRGGGYGTFPTVADKLAIGCLLAIWAPRLPKVKAYLALPMVVAVALIPLFSAHSVARTILMLFVLQPLLHASIAGILLHVVQTPYRFLNWGPVAWLGRISYSLYLWQQPFCSDPALRSGYLAFLAIAFACLSYYCVEQPMLRLRERRSAEQPREAAPRMLPSSAAAG